VGALVRDWAPGEGVDAEELVSSVSWATSLAIAVATRGEVSSRRPADLARRTRFAIEDALALGRHTEVASCGAALDPSPISRIERDRVVKEGAAISEDGWHLSVCDSPERSMWVWLVNVFGSWVVIARRQGGGHVGVQVARPALSAVRGSVAASFSVDWDTLPLYACVVAVSGPSDVVAEAVESDSLSLQPLGTTVSVPLSSPLPPMDEDPRTLPPPSSAPPVSASEESVVAWRVSASLFRASAHAAPSIALLARALCLPPAEGLQCALTCIAGTVPSPSATLTEALRPPPPPPPPLPVASGSVPQHIAIVMDGNGRWAKARGLPRTQGHAKGVETMLDTVRSCRRLGVQYLTLYAFSAQNWKRPALEVQALMSLLIKFLRTDAEELVRNGVRVRIIGEMQHLPEAAQSHLRSLIARSRRNSSINLCLALSYGGREEITSGAVAACRAARAGVLDPEDLTPSRFRAFLPHPSIPDPDLVIRTSGEVRISNFLLWQIAYSELVVLDCLWPDFDEKQLLTAIQTYSRRSRRFGLTQEQAAAATEATDPVEPWGGADVETDTVAASHVLSSLHHAASALDKPLPLMKKRLRESNSLPSHIVAALQSVHGVWNLSSPVSSRLDDTSVIRRALTQSAAVRKVAEAIAAKLPTDGQWVAACVCVSEAQLAIPLAGWGYSPAVHMALPGGVPLGLKGEPHVGIAGRVLSSRTLTRALDHYFPSAPSVFAFRPGTKQACWSAMEPWACPELAEHTSTQPAPWAYSSVLSSDLSPLSHWGSLARVRCWGLWVAARGRPTVSHIVSALTDSTCCADVR
jgi:undecaprenyl diphosphate synthase